MRDKKARQEFSKITSVLDIRKYIFLDEMGSIVLDSGMACAEFNLRDIGGQKNGGRKKLGAQPTLLSTPIHLF